MQKTTLKTAIIALMTSILISTLLIGVVFAGEDLDGNRIEFPVPAWQFDGPGAWWTQADVKNNYNQSNAGFNPYSTVPKTPHVLWASVTQPGGVVGGKDPASGIYENYHFLGGAANALVYGNRLFYAAPTQTHGTSMYYVCLDSETGEKLWISDPLPTATWAVYSSMMTLKFSSQGAVPSLVVPVGRTLYFIDMTTGRVGLKKELDFGVSFIVAGWDDTLGQERPSYGSSANEVYAYGTQSLGTRRTRLHCYRIINFSSRHQTAELIWETEVNGDGWFSPQVSGQYIVSGDEMDEIAYCLNRFTGEKIWEISNTAYPTGSIGYGKYFCGKDDQYLYAYDIATGNLAWKSEVPLKSFFNQHGHCVGEGLVVSEGFDGRTVAFDVETGKRVWEYYVGDCPYEPYASWYGTWPYNQMAIGGVGAFVGQTGDHIGHNPAVPGERLTVWDAQTGRVRWTFPSVLSCHNAWGSIANGMLFGHDMYTGKLFGFGKGPSSVTVSTDSAKINKGEYVTIMGTVMDDSPGQAGTPCVSSEDMQAWMEYLHAGMPPVQDKTGVTLTLYAEDMYGNTITIGDVETDGDTGMFVMQWVPPEEGVYTITGVFLGDDSYWDSYGSTTLAVGGMASTPSAVSASSAASALTATASVATVVAAAVAFLVLRKPFSKKKEDVVQ